MMNIYGEFTDEEIGVIRLFKDFLENQVLINGSTFKVAVSNFADKYSTIKGSTIKGIGGHPVLAGGFLARILYCCNKRRNGDLLPEEDYKYLSGGDMDIFISGLPLDSATPDSDRAVSLNKFYYMFQNIFEFKTNTAADPYKVRNPNIIEIGVNNNDIPYSMPAMGYSQGRHRTTFYFPKRKGVQVVFTKYADRDACIGHFDYEHLKISYCLLTNTLKLSPLAFRCATRKLLMANNSNQAPAEWRRKKFLDMGFVENDLQPKLL